MLIDSERAPVHCSSLVELLRIRAAERPTDVAYTFLADGEEEAGSLTYGELDRQARAIGAALREAGASGAPVLLLFPPGLEFVAAFLGCLYGGAAAVPAYPPRSRRTLPRLRSIVADARPAAALTTGEILGRLDAMADALPELGAGEGESGVRLIATDALDRADPEAAERWVDPEAGPDTLAFLQYTSGSTAAPKGVRVTHGNLLHNEEMIRRAFGQSEESVIVGWLPLYHDMGLIGNVLQPLYVGARCVLMSPVAFLQKPSRWLRAISRYRATTSGGPNFAYDLCARKARPEEGEGEGELDLSSWRVAFNGAEPVRAETLERFAAAFAPHGFRREAFYPCYGLAEATLFVTGGALDEAPAVASLEPAALEAGRAVDAGEPEAGRRLVGCGHVWAGQEVRIVDPERLEPLADGRVGEIWVHGPSVADGYWKNPEVTEAEFRARLPQDDSEEDAGPYLRTGDLGFLRDGELFVTGRLKDLIILRGRNLYPQDVERTAETAHPALRPGCGAAFALTGEASADGEERLVLVQEVHRRHHKELDAGAVADAVRMAVAAEHDAAVDTVVLIRHGTILKTSSGKIRRRACREALLAGELREVGRSRAAPAEEESAGAPHRDDFLELSGTERRRALASWLRDELGRAAGVDPSRLAGDAPLALDSLAAMEL
ncbi:MAG: fatty acyl-AMP ligase, partial [Acidobacteriota bacterium]